jgi:formylglycine-generating enzyme required for sulfatase activity/tRNA A-37 threonylcarbamoyl transferase component Bud32
MAGSFVGKTIDKYRVIELIAWGGMAEVYKAHQQGLDRYVAIKVMHAFLAEQEGFLERFRREAKAVAQLRHPNIVRVYDFDVTDEGNHYMVMEFIDGVTLETRLQEIAAQSDLLPLEEAIRIARAVATALAYAHRHGMVHRDVKPSNVMLNHDQEVILTDFGIAKILSNPQYTASGAMIGTPSYVSPEQGLGEPGDARSDIYSLGVMFFQMVTGRLPYQAEKPVSVVFKHINDPVPIPRQFNPLLPPEIDDIVSKAMAKRLNARYQTAEAFIRDLDKIRVVDSVADVATFKIPTDTDVEVAERALNILSPAAPASVAPSSVLSHTIRLTPYTLSPGRVVTCPADLVAVCDADWQRAVDHFAKGYITEWLREGVHRLRLNHQHGLADELELVALRAKAIVDRIGAGDEITRNAGLEEFLELLGAHPPIMEITPKALNLPEVGKGKTGQAAILTVRNKGRGYLFGTVVCQEPWLTASPKWFGCGPEESVQIVVQPNLSKQPAGHLHSPRGVEVRSIAGDLSLPVRVDVLPSLLQVERSHLDFGQVGRGETVQTSFTLRNGGRGYLTGRVHSRVPWLCAWPEEFRVPAQESLRITVELDAETLSPGEVNSALAMAVESDGGYAVLGVRAHVLAPQMAVEPEQIELGTMDLAQTGTVKAAELRVSNTGPGVLTVQIGTDADWLVIEPAALRCRSGETRPVRVSTGGVTVGDHNPSIHVTSKDAAVQIPLHLKVAFSLRPEMVRIPAGEFLRGSLEEDKAALVSEKPQRRIHLSEYRIGRHPVTNAQYAVFAAATGRRPPEHWTTGVPPKELRDHPVVNVSWWDALAYCRWLSEVTGQEHRLPTEAEWEKAARGTDGGIYPWGNRWDDTKCNAGSGSQRDTTPVDAYSPAGDSPFGCADMAGNVLEWVADWYDAEYYALSSITQDPFGPASGVVRALRGGSWSSSAREVRCASRFNANPTITSPKAGFRCVCI